MVLGRAGIPRAVQERDRPPSQSKDAKCQSGGLPREGKNVALPARRQGKWQLPRAPGNLLVSDFMSSGAWTRLIMNFPCMCHFGLQRAQGTEDAPVTPEPGRESKQGFHVEK